MSMVLRRSLTRARRVMIGHASVCSRHGESQRLLDEANLIEVVLKQTAGLAPGAGPRRKGAGYERDVVRWLNAEGFGPVERRIAGMDADTGDLTGLPGVVIECKNQNTISLGAWFSQLEAERAQAAAKLGALFIKRRGTADVSRHYVVMSGADFLELLGTWISERQG
jgi:hypothetical protein